MVGWRISKRRYANPPAAAFDGEGSKRRGGRWTPPGRRVAYASSNLALASFEYFVNLDPQDAPPDLVSIRMSISDVVRYEKVSISALPDSWRMVPFPQELWEIGERWLVSASSVCLLVPSAWSRRSSTCSSTRCTRISKTCSSRSQRRSPSILGCGSDR
jgi:RES domain-containing protein